MTEPSPLFAMSQLGVSLISKDESKLMQLLGVLAFWNPILLSDLWTTLTLPGWRVIYYPTKLTREEAEARVPTLTHELRHVAQADRLIPRVRWLSNLVWNVVYLASPYHRMKWEIEAYVAGWLAYPDVAKRPNRYYYGRWVAITMWKTYLAWPEAWSYKRFQKELDRQRGDRPWIS